MPFKINPPRYDIWKAMKSRCYNPNNPQYKNYGGRGIEVCDRWVSSYKNFADDMLPSYKEGLTLDRIDNERGYSPDNCRWTTQREQNLNRRNTVYVEIEGISYKATELADKSGRKLDTIIDRANAGLSYEAVMSSERRKGIGWKAAIAQRVANSRARTHCSYGHEFTKENEAFTKEGWRRCKTCHRERARRKTAEKRSAQHGHAPLP